MSEFDNFIELLKSAPSYVKDNVMYRKTMRKFLGVTNG